MRFTKLALFSLLLSNPLTHSFAQFSEDPADGNSISEPELRDYVQANRAPGILVEPYDIIEAD